MHNIHKLPKHISHIISRYIITGIIGSSFITGCSNSGPSYGMDSKEVDPANSTPATQNSAVQTPDEHGNLEIHLAAINNDLDKVKRLVAEDPKVLEAVNNYGNTPLHVAALRGYIEVVSYIIEWARQLTSSNLLSIKNNNGHIPADQAERKGHKAVYDLLKEAGTDLNIPMCQT